MSSFLTASNLSSMLAQKLRNSDQDNIQINSAYIEYNLYLLYKIDVINYIKTKASLSKNFHIQPSEIDSMPMWEYELFIRNMNDMVKEENDEQQKEMDKYNVGDYKKIADNSIKNFSQPKMPSMPSMPKL